MTHTCETCLKVFKQKGHLIAHHARKTPCSPPSNLEQLIKEKVQEKVNEVLKQMNMNTETNEIIVPHEPEPAVKRTRPKIAKVKQLEAKQLEAKQLQMIDLFAGTGAFSSAFESTGAVQCVFANDMVPWSKVIYDANHSSSTVLLQDLNTVPTEEIPRHDLLTGGFPCFVAGTQVCLENGYKPIEDVNIGDMVLTHNNMFQQVLNLQSKFGVEEIYEVQISHRPYPIKCTAEHPFYVREKMREWDNSHRRYNYSYSEPAWINSKDLTKKHYVGMPINTENIIPEFNYSKKVNQFTEEQYSIILSTTDQWFMMGYFLGDGWVQDSVRKDGRNVHTIMFSIADKDRDTVLPLLQKVVHITDTTKRSGASSVYGTHDVGWWTVLKQFGKYSHGKHIPQWVHSAPIECIDAFLKGYQSADGCIQSSSNGIQNHHISYTTVSSDIAFGIQRLYLKMGKVCSIDYTIRPSTYVIQGRTVQQRNTYRMRVVLNPTKESSCMLENGYAWYPIKYVTVSACEPITVYNLEVAIDHSYCVENAIVHNCQPFSIAGKREGFDDARSNVFWKILEIIDHHRPRALVLENVKNLVSHDEGQTFKTIKENLEQRGYHLRYKVLDTAEITGVPQHRERIYLVCLKEKEVFDQFSLDFPVIPRRLITELLEPASTIDNKYYYTDKSSTWPLVSEAITEQGVIYQYRRVYVRDNKSGVCPTLTANMGGGGHNVPLVLDERGIRKLTPRECFRFQGFPDSYVLPDGMSDTNLYKLAGNAVSYPVVKLIADRLVPLLMRSTA